MTTSDARARLPARFHSMGDVAARLGLSKRFVQRDIDAGNLVVHRFGRRVLVSDEDLATYIRSRRRG